MSESVAATALIESVATNVAVAPITRPNDVTAYAVGDVYTDAVIAGALPTGLVQPAGTRGLLALSLAGIQRRSAADAFLNLGVMLFTAQPAAIVDNAPLALSDADIALAVFGTTGASGQLAFSASSNNTALSFAAGAAGRRRAVVAHPVSILASIVGVTTIPVPTYFYLWATAAYVPLAQERIDFTFTAYWLL